MTDTCHSAFPNSGHVNSFIICRERLVAPHLVSWPPKLTCKCLPLPLTSSESTKRKVDSSLFGLDCQHFQLPFPPSFPLLNVTHSILSTLPRCVSRLILITILTWFFRIQQNRVGLSSLNLGFGLSECEMWCNFFCCSVSTFLLSSSLFCVLLLLLLLKILKTKLFDRLRLWEKRPNFLSLFLACRIVFSYLLCFYYYYYFEQDASFVVVFLRLRRRRHQFK